LRLPTPYLFYAYEFRRFCLLAKLIVTIGYSFGDLHINKMLTQALRTDTDRRLMVVARCSRTEITQKKNEIATRLGIGPERIIPQQGSAKSFLENQNISEAILGLVPRSADSPF
jgi:hypothetical protein